MRVFKYFSNGNVNDVQNSKEYIGSSPHTDWGFLTVIIQDDVTGLQYSYNGQWVDVQPVIDSVVVN